MYCDESFAIAAVQGGVTNLGLDFNSRALEVLQRHIDATRITGDTDLILWQSGSLSGSLSHTYIDYGDGTSSPTTNSICDLSLQQQIDDFVSKKTVQEIVNLKLDIIAFDENHFHGTTEKADKIFQTYGSTNTCILLLTATYSKLLMKWNIPEDCQFYWDIEDELMCKQRNVAGIKEKHGADDVSLFLNSDNVEQLLSAYDKMPDLHLMTTMMNHSRYESIKHSIKDTSYGFSNGTLFSNKKL